MAKRLELKDTVALMNSADYKERFMAEYAQLQIRRCKLFDMLYKWDNGILNFVPTCPRGLYTVQLSVMDSGLALLEERARLEGVNLSDIQHGEIHSKA